MIDTKTEKLLHLAVHWNMLFLFFNIFPVHQKYSLYSVHNAIATMYQELEN